MTITTTAAVIEKDSHADASDPNWCHARETVLLLNLAVSHIEESMRDGDISIAHLTDTFSSMADTVQQIEKVVELNKLTNSKYFKNIDEQCHVLNDAIQKTIIAFQFYDRLVQKLNHVSHSMDALCELLTDQVRIVNVQEWTALQENIRARYTMESERIMFDELMKGASVQKALRIARQHKMDFVQKHDEIDLF